MVGLSPLSDLKNVTKKTNTASGSQKKIILKHEETKQEEDSDTRIDLSAKKADHIISCNQELVLKHEESNQEEDMDTDSEFSDQENMEAFDIMKRREENLRLNREFFQQLGMDEAKLGLMSAKKPKIAPSKRGLKKEPVVLPRRTSLRLQRKDPEGGDLPPEALINKMAAYAVVDEHPRPPAGPLLMTEYLESKFSSLDQEHRHLVSVISSLKPVTIEPSLADLDSYIAAMKKTRITAERVAKVVPNRIYSVTFHPSPNRVLVATGDTWGKLGILDVCSEEKLGSDGVCCYSPHSRPITCLEFPPFAPHHLYSCGYDGTLRRGDFESGVFDEVYSVPEEDDVLLRNFSFTSPHTMLVSQNTGNVALVDTRSKSTKAESTYDLNMRALRTVSVHPLQKEIFCTAGVEGTLRVWDLRKMKMKKNEPIVTLPHGKSINSAYFSPLTGKYILSTSLDDRLTIFDSSVISAEIKPSKIISHNNHTGRWLTGFRATWHPAREDVFVVGSMNRPREITLFSDKGKKLHSFLDPDHLGSVCSLNALHTSRAMLVGANSSGRLHVFM
ncbi:WD repeat-containing protein 76-like isoform X2 [Dreissena polymorpha]|nr:WD repeat-containing protein 76-like isoform X2 [Dreissena polymorpha]